MLEFGLIRRLAIGRFNHCNPEKGDCFLLVCHAGQQIHKIIVGQGLAIVGVLLKYDADAVQRKHLTHQPELPAEQHESLKVHNIVAMGDLLKGCLIVDL